MDARRQQLIEEVFLAAAACEDGAARDGVILEKCGGDAALAAEVRSLLGGHEASGGVLDRRSIAVPASLGLRETLVTPEDAPVLPEGTRIAGYVLGRMIGAGGMGVVYEAEQERPRRTVAVKLIRAGPGGMSRGLLRRFDSEADILARLHHPGIAQVYEAGSAVVEVLGAESRLGEPAHHKQPYLVMELVQGPPITRYAEQANLGTREKLELLAQVCEAVQHAHQRGVIHRDLKPSNVLVDTSGGGAQVKVLDFGVARVTDADVRVTTLQTGLGQLIGTLPYMSPEQVAGDPNEVDTRSDVYALGVVMYQLLTGRLPHDLSSRSIPEAARIIRDEHPSRLSSISRVFRGDVDTIVAKALEKERERRYQSANELAEDIRRYLSGEPIAAKRDSFGYVLQKRVRRYRLTVTVGAVALVGMAALGVVAGVSAVRNRRLAQQLTRELSTSTLERARLMGQTNQLGQAEDVAWNELVKNPESRLAWWTLWDLYERSPTVRSLPSHAIATADCAFSPDGKCTAVANRRNGIAEVFDAELERRICTLHSASERMFGVAFSPDSLRVATGTMDGEVAIWDVASGAKVASHMLARLKKGEGDEPEWVGTVAYSPDGSLLATAGRAGVVRLWSPIDLESRGELRGHTEDVLGMAWAPDGGLLASGSNDHTVILWDVDAKKPLKVLDEKAGGHTFNVGPVAISRDGKTMATAGFDRKLKLWDLRGAETTCRTTVDVPSGFVDSLAFNADSTRLYSGSDGVEERDPADGRVRRSIVCAEGGRHSLALSPDGARLLTSSGDGRVALWETRASPSRTDLPKVWGFAGRTVFLDNDRILTAAAKGRFRLCAADGTGDAKFGGDDQQAVRLVSATSDGKYVLMSMLPTRLSVWSAATCEQVASVVPHPGSDTAVVSPSPDGTMVLTVAFDKSARLWKLPDLEPVEGAPNLLEFAGPGPTPIHEAAWSADGRLVTIATSRQKMAVWRIGESAPAAVLEFEDAGGAAQTAAMFAPDGRLVVALGRDIRVYDWERGRKVAEYLGHTNSVMGLTLAKSSRGEVLASVGRDRTLRLWDWPPPPPGSSRDAGNGGVVAGAELMVIPTGENAGGSIASSPDGGKLAVSMDRGLVSVWDLRHHEHSITANAAYHLGRIVAERKIPPEQIRRARERLMPGLPADRDDAAE